MYNAENVISQIVMGGAAKAMEGGAKATVILSKNLVAMLLALYQQRTRSKGKISISNLEKRFPEINTLKLSEEQLKEFQQQAKRYNILYSVIKPTFLDSLSEEKDDYIDIVIAEKDAAKLERISEKLGWDSSVLDSLTSTKITKKDKDSKEELMVEIESKNKHGQKLKMNVPLKNIFNPRTEAEAEAFRSFLGNIDFINPEGIVQNISDVNLEDELNKFSEKEKKLEAGRESLLSELSEEPAKVEIESEQDQDLLKDEVDKEIEEQKVAEQEENIEEQGIDEINKNESEVIEEINESESDASEQSILENQKSLTEMLDEIKEANEEKKISTFEVGVREFEKER